ncbi:hypothetical protein ACQ4M4_22795 [Leptolyngbya sp. AN02str]|uniref:hypothetical protein n=1 Tax=Leptolyngbya sp. AN02str TaxID=3423363 RepID=UPI003D315379
MYIVEFSFAGSHYLADDLLIQAPTEDQAKDYALQHAQKLGLKLHSILPASEQQICLYQQTGKTVVPTIHSYHP